MNDNNVLNDNNVNNDTNVHNVNKTQNIMTGTPSPTHRPSVADCAIVTLPKITDPRGNLTVAEEHINVPFDIRRVYWIYDVPGGESRGGHAHRRLRQLLIPMSGSFHVVIDDGRERREVLLNHPWQGLLIVPGIWRTLEDFSSGAVCMVLASELFDEDEYIYDYAEFKEIYGG